MLQAYISFLILVVLATLVLQMVQTLPGMSVISIVPFNKTTCHRTNSSPEFFTDDSPTGGYKWTYAACTFYFTVDWIARLVCAPTARVVLLSPVTYMDLVALLPVYIRMILEAEGCILYKDPRVREVSKRCCRLTSSILRSSRLIYEYMQALLVYRCSKR